MIDTKTKLCCVIGDPIAQSPSPHLHNSLYKKIGLNYVFLAFRVKDVKKAIVGLRAINATGISVTIPHKSEVMRYVDEVDAIAQEIGAVNTIVNRNGKFIASNTDWIGGIKALERKVQLAGKKVALLGAGGAGRALAYGLKKKGVIVSVFNRTKTKAEGLKRSFNLACAYGLNDIGKIKDADIIVNTTSLGMMPNDDISPIPSDCITSQQIVFDIVTKPVETQLIKYAKKKKAVVIYGYEMILYGVSRQFELFTGKKPPVNLIEKILVKYLKIDK